MGDYISTTKQEQEEMLREIGFEKTGDLFAHLPEEILVKGELLIPKGMTELSVKRKMEETAEKNTVFKTVFRGAGAYRHFIPSIVKSVVSKEDFLTAYTPYQAEISQGNLQAVFEYQSMICALTGMEVSNASVYDGACAAAEALFMCLDKKRTKVLVSQTTDPQIVETMRTYCFGRNTELLMVPECDGETDREALLAMLDKETACFFQQQPNYYGILEASDELSELVHEKGAKFIMSCNPIALAIMKTPGECNADIAVGEGQPLGIPLGYGGPYLGFMAASREMMRRLPGRIVGETVDSDGNRSFVLTLQAREQHIRREKASSNICSNQALCALTASVYLSAMGAEGLRNCALQCTSKAHYLQHKLKEAGAPPAFDKPFFHEFVTTFPKDADVLMKKLRQYGILGGLVLENGRILWCATELNTKAEMDLLAEVVKEVCGK